MRRLWKIAMVLPALALAGSLSSCKLVDGWIAFDQIGRDLRAPASAPPARMDLVGGTPVIHLYGTPRDRGEQYGRLLASPLQALHRCIVDLTSSQRYAGIIAYAEAHERALPPDVRAELHAVSDASGMPYLELVSLNITPTMACSALATWNDRATGEGAPAPPAGAPGPDQGLVMGRNADYFSYGFTDRGMLVVVCHPKEGVPVASVTFLGMVGAFTGMNARGVAFGNMLVPTVAPHRHEDGLTIQLALRLAAEGASTADEMAHGLSRQRHVIPMNVMVADPEHALALELDGGGAVVRQGDHGVLVSTNHFLHLPIACASDSCDRYAILQAAARASGGPMTVEQMKRALWDARGQNNIQAVIFEPGRLRMHVSINHAPAAGGPYVVLDLHDLFTPAELGLLPATQPAADTSKMLIDFRKPASVEGWQSTDDGVIGGKSQGAMKASASTSAVFEGTISQQSGGFVTVRCPNGAFDLSGFSGLEIRVRGDGKAYQAMVKTEAVDTGFSYYYWFQTREGAWQTVRLVFREFKANFRGLNVAWSHLDPAKAVSLGFLIANWQEGPFRLEIESIKAYK